MSETPIVYFDGVCGLCNGFVDFLLRRGGGGRLRFAALQGGTAAADLPEERTRDLDTLALRSARGLSYKSTAVLRALAFLPFPWPGVLLLLAVPRPLRDFVYDQVARRRYGWFGRRDSCRRPEPGEETLFLP